MVSLITVELCSVLHEIKYFIERNLIIITWKRSSILNLVVPKSSFRLQAGAMRIGTENVDDMLGCLKKHLIDAVRLLYLLFVHFSMSELHTLFIQQLNIDFKALHFIIV